MIKPHQALQTLHLCHWQKPKPHTSAVITQTTRHTHYCDPFCPPCHPSRPCLDVLWNSGISSETLFFLKCFSKPHLFFHALSETWLFHKNISSSFPTALFSHIPHVTWGLEMGYCPSVFPLQRWEAQFSSLNLFLPQVSSVQEVTEISLDFSSPNSITYLWYPSFIIPAFSALEKPTNTISKTYPTLSSSLPLYHHHCNPSHSTVF